VWGKGRQECQPGLCVAQALKTVLVIVEVRLSRRDIIKVKGESTADSSAILSGQQQLTIVSVRSRGMCKNESAHCVALAED
jgi:hypothetical protein